MFLVVCTTLPLESVFTDTTQITRATSIEGILHGFFLFVSVCVCACMCLAHTTCHIFPVPSTIDVKQLSISLQTWRSHVLFSGLSSIPWRVSMFYGESKHFVLRNTVLEKSHLHPRPHSVSES
jgi:hypothetical protein